MKASPLRLYGFAKLRRPTAAPTEGARCAAQMRSKRPRRPVPPCFIGPSFFHGAAWDLARRPLGPQAMASFGAAVDDPKEAS